MLKFVAIIAFASLVCAAPHDPKSTATHDGSKKMNHTENAASDSKAVPAYTFGDYLNRQPVSFYSQPTKPVYSSPLMRPTISVPSSYQGVFGDAKNGHLRPQWYQSQQAQPYTYPAQSYQSYPQSIYFSGYPSPQPYYGNYGYSGYYKAKEQPQPEMVMQPTPGILIEKPVTTQRIGRIPVSPDQQVSNMASRDASGYWPPIMPLPQDNSGQIDRRRDILIDDSNLQIEPSLLLDRLHLQSNAPIYRSGRSIEDVSPFGLAAGPEDDVYLITNKYDQHPLLTKATFEDTLQPIGRAQMNSGWMPPVSNAPVASNGNTPFSHENILNAMSHFYAAEYMNQMAKNQPNVLPKSKSVNLSDDELVLAIAKEIFNKIKADMSKQTEPKQPAKPEEKKETSTPVPKTN